MNPAQPRIAVCTASVGHGHSRAAHALADALRASRPEAIVEIVDALSLAPAWFVRCYRDAYLATVTRVPPLAGWLYAASDRAQNPAGIGLAVERYAMRRFASDERVLGADAIVCTHFLCGRVLSALKGLGELHAPLTICITDQHPHAVWLSPHADRLFVPSESARGAAIRAGARPERVSVTGIPIDGRFSNRVDQRAARQALALPRDRPIALVSGGGLGMGGMESTVRALMGEGNTRVAPHVVAVCGHNTACRTLLSPLAREPDARSPRTPSCTVLGFTEQMPTLMAAADVLVGKPGGLTTAEAAAAGLPMVLIRPIPGQEERNAERLVSEGAAVLERDPGRAGAIAAELLADPSRLAAMRERSAAMGRPDAARLGAAIVLALLRRSQPAGADASMDPGYADGSLVAVG